MSEPKFTKGPWSAYKSGKTIAICIGDSANGRRPCIVDWPGFDSCDLPFQRQVANAHLIASAPEMYEKLTYFYEQLKTEHIHEIPIEKCPCRTAREWRSVDRVLRKATGGDV